MTAHHQKRQHYFAQFHLAGFTERHADRRAGMLWLVDIEERKVRRASPRDVAHERQFYDWRESSRWKESGSPPELETFFKAIEDRAAPVLHRFASVDFRQLALTDEERNDLSNYIGLKQTRTPLALEVIHATEKTVIESRMRHFADDPSFEEKYRRFVESHPNRNRLPSPSEARSLIKTNPPRVVPNRDRSLALAIRTGLESVAALVFHMPWCCLVAPNDLFFTSDHPVFMHSKNDRAETIEISLALSSRVRLVAHAAPRPEGRGNIIYLSERETEACNRVVLQAVHRFFFCPTQSLAEWTLTNYADADTESVLAALDAPDQR